MAGCSRRSVAAQYSDRWSGGGWVLWYSLENALPLIETIERFKGVEHGRPWLDHFFRFQKVSGFVLATVVAGALTLLSSRTRRSSGLNGLGASATSRQEHYLILQVTTPVVWRGRGRRGSTWRPSLPTTIGLSERQSLFLA